MKKEIEIKIKVSPKELEYIDSRLTALDAYECSEFADWALEKTYGFFTPDGSSIKEGIFPRVKITMNNTVMGLKIKTKEDDKYFEREEYEFSTDIMTAVSFWKALGFTKVRIFEKLRKKYKHLDCKVCLDKLPFGTYIEVEGEKRDIEKVVKDLGLGNNERITKAYLKIADELGLENALFGDSK